jgi:AraC-like DNA-binding protein
MSILTLEEMVEQIRQPEPDVLSEVLRAVRLTSALFFDNAGYAPWVATTPTVADVAHFVMPRAEHVIPFHIVTAGSCWVSLVDDPSSAVLLREGDAVLFPGGDEHSLGSSPDLRDQPRLEDWNVADQPLPVTYVLNGGEGRVEACHFVCGFLGCDARPFNPLLAALPRMLRARTSESTQRLLVSLVGKAIAETRGRGAGSDSALTKVAELMFVEVIRWHMDNLPADAVGWLAALRDRHVGAALRLMHSRPAEPWTIESLARNVGLSRSRFAERFTAHLGTSPIQYLGRWRIQLASRLLEQQGANVARVAAEVGYASEEAFQRAFKKLIGMPPGAWRKEHAALPPAPVTASA